MIEKLILSLAVTHCDLTHIDQKNILINSARTRHQAAEGNSPLANEVPSDGVMVPDKETH